jgi:putative ABC transport system ATP-binding protein
VTVISCRAVSRWYAAPGLQPLTAVRDVDLDIEASTFVAIEGPSGSGKTTLLGLLAGLEAPDAGEISVVGHDLRRLNATERAQLRQLRIGIVFQTFGLIASLRAGENVGLPLAFARIDPAEREARARGALEEVGLGAAYDKRIDELSGGERQRVGVARAIVIEPTVILADEPTGSLDGESAGQVLTVLIDAVRRRGASLVLVTHDPESAARADRQLHMRDGRLFEGQTA